MKVLLSTAYWPNLHYFYYLLNAEEVQIEQYEHYQKQSFRNRTQILAANGRMDLFIPIKKVAHKEIIKDIGICYKDRWRQTHWGAIKSAYGNSPYFEYFSDEISALYESEFPGLLDFNNAQIKLVLSLLKIKKEISYTDHFEVEPHGWEDKRNEIHPKKSFLADSQLADKLNSAYYQTFGQKFGFVPNLSILDLLFNKGLQARDYLFAV